jgi:hypothetical protein
VGRLGIDRDIRTMIAIKKTKANMCDFRIYLGKKVRLSNHHGNESYKAILKPIRK